MYYVQASKLFVNTARLLLYVRAIALLCILNHLVKSFTFVHLILIIKTWVYNVQKIFYCHILLLY